MCESSAEADIGERITFRRSVSFHNDLVDIEAWNDRRAGLERNAGMGGLRTARTKAGKKNYKKITNDTILISKI